MPSRLLPMPSGRTAAAGLRVPRLDGIARSASLPDEQLMRPRLVHAMTEAGVMSPTHQGDMAQALSHWVRQHGADIVDRRYELAAFLVRDVNEFNNEADDSTHCVLALDATSAHPLRFGPTIAWLERIDPHLPATVYHALTETGRAIRHYDRWDAENHWEMRTDGMDDDQDIAELPVRTCPAALERKPLGVRAIAQRRRRWPADVCAVVDLAIELQRLGDAFGRIRPTPTDAEYSAVVGDMGQCVPGLVIAMEDHDWITAAFDDESQYMLEMEPEPNLWWLIPEFTASRIATAFAGLGHALELLATGVRLMDLLPERHADVAPVRSRVRVHAGRPLADVLVDAFVEVA